MAQNWQPHFIHTGNQGSETYAAAIDQVTRELKALFEQADKPYSGLEPKSLEKAIRALSLTQANVAGLDKIISETTELIAKHSILVQHPHCIAHLHTPPLVAGLAAESFIGALNQSMDSWDQASAATYVEQKISHWLCARYGLGDNADGVFTSGGTQSNLMGLLLARDWAADTLSGHNIQKNGLPDYAQKLRILCSSKSHFTVKKSAALMGLGERAVICVDTHTDGTIKIDRLEETLQQLKEAELLPFALVGTAGTTDHGAIDDLTAMADIAKAYSLWFHVDAAYGGALILSSSSSRLAGIEKADSITVDFHKLFYQPISCGAVLLKNQHNFKYLLHHADYLNREEDELPNLVDKTIATTKRFDALKVLMTLRAVGEETLGAMFDHLLVQTKQVAELIRQDNRFTLVAEPSLSTVLLRYEFPHLGELNPERLNQLNRQLRIDLLTKGIAVLGETVVDGRVCLKFTLLNPCLTLNDFNALLSNIAQFATDKQ